MHRARRMFRSSARWSIDHLEARMLLSLPSGWTDADIGSVPTAGSASSDSTTGTFTVAGSGADIAGSSDQFNFASQNVSIDGSTIARVTAVQNTDPAAKAAVMFRNDSTASSAFVDVVVTPGSGVSFQWRSAGGTTTGNVTAPNITAPIWIKLTRSSINPNVSNFLGYYSTDGSNWIQVGSSLNANVGTNALTGLAVTSRTSGLNTSTFTNVTTPIALPKLAFTSAAQSVTAGVVSGTMTVQLEDSSGNPTNAGTGGQVVNLASSSTAGTFLNGSAAITSVTVAAGSSSASFAYKDTISGTPTLTASASGMTAATQQETITAAAASQIVFLTAPVTTAFNVASSTITVQLKDQFGNTAAAGTGGLSLSLTSSSSTGTFLNGTTPITSVTVSSGASTASFTYRDSTIGAPILTVAGSGVGSVMQQETISASVPTKIAFSSPPVTTTTGTISAPVTIQLEDSTNAPVNAGTGGVTVNLSSSSTGGSFLDSSDHVITTLLVPAGSSTASFEYQDTQSGTPTLTAAASSLTSATQQETIAVAGTTLVTFTSSPQTIAAGAISSNLTIALQDAVGNPVVAGAGGQIVNLSTSSSGGVFFSGGNAVSSVVVPAGSSSASFTYQDTVAAVPVLAAFATGFSSAIQQETVTAIAPVSLAFTTSSTGILQGSPSVNLVVDLLDMFGNIAVAPSGGTTINFSTTSSGGTFQTTGGATITSQVIAAGSSSATIRYEDTIVGAPIITAAATGLNSATQQETIDASTSTPISVGSGSYASTPPGGANANIVYGSQYDWINRPNNSPLPTNDWWTLILSPGFAGSLYSLPQELFTASNGITVNGFTGTQSINNNIGYAGGQSILVGGNNAAFTRDALVNYGDWDVKFRMEQTADQYIDVTTVQGDPMSWYQFNNLSPTLTLGTAGSYGNIFDGSGASLGNGGAGFTTDHFRFAKTGVNFGVFAPPGTVFVPTTNGLNVVFAGADHYIVVAVLPDNTNATFAAFYQNAYSLPTNTTYGYSVNTPAATMTTTWNVTTVPLKTGASGNIIQGWLPTNYRDINSGPALLSGFSYPTIYGPIRLSLGNSFNIVQPTNSLAFDLPAPQQIGGTADYSPAMMATFLNNYTLTPGADSYGGMVTLGQAAELTLMAKQLNDPNYSRLLTILQNGVTNWLTDAPLPTDQFGFNFFFTYYPPDHALIAYPTAFGSEHYTDIDFHYGYLTSAAAVLAMLNPTWGAQYGAIATMVAQSYANWNRSDTSEPYLRTFDPWAGHSYADGLGNSLGNQGNDQESTSEAIDSWQGLVLLGQALGNQAMTDAGIMGYTMETKAETEYWLNVAHQDLNPAGFPANTGTAINADFSREHQTFFGGSAKYVLGIEGMPDWPSMDFLGKYNPAMQAEIDTAINSLGGWSGVDPSSLQDGNDWLAVLLGMQGQVNPQDAANQFAVISSLNSFDASNSITGIAYYNTYSNRTYGLRDWNYHLSLPVGGVYTNSSSQTRTFIVYNPAPSAQTVQVFDASGNVIASFSAAADTVTTEITSFAWQAGAALSIKYDPAADPIAVSATGNLVTALENGVTLNFLGVSSVTVNFAPAASDVLNFFGPLAAPITFVNQSSSDTLNIDSGTFTFPAPPAGSGITPNVWGTLFIASGANAILAPPATHGDRTVLILNSLSIAGSINNWQGQLDLNSNDLIVQNGNLSNLANQLKTGLNAHSGYWNGATGIISSSAANDTTFLRTLGYRNGGIAFDGVNTTSNDVLVKYTYYGDADLNGTINGADYQQIDQGFGTQTTGWFNGDFNNDGAINGSDFALIDNAFNQLSATGAAPLAVPAARSSATQSKKTLAAVSNAISMPIFADSNGNAWKLYIDSANDDVLVGYSNDIQRHHRGKRVELPGWYA